MIMTCVIYGFILEKVGKKSENQNKTEKKKKKKKKKEKKRISSVEQEFEFCSIKYDFDICKF